MLGLAHSKRNRGPRALTFADETDIHVPFLFNGPGIAQGAVLPHMSGNIDIMPTILDLAGGPSAVPGFVDGKSMLPFLLPAVGEARGFKDSEWRDYFLVEYKSVGTYFNDHSNCAGTPQCADGQGMPRSPHGSGGGKCVESNVTGGGNCYFVDSTHSNSWRLLRINNADENIAYVEYDPAYAWETTNAMGSGLQYYELYDVAQDPYQMTNLYGSANVTTKTRLHTLMVKYYACSGNWTHPSNCG